MNFVNLTPHALVIYRSQEDGDPITVTPSGTVARIATRALETELVGDGIPVTSTALIGIQGLPEPQPDVMYITSGMVVEHLGAWGPQRMDVVAPGELRRDADGRPVGCLGLRR